MAQPRPKKYSRFTEQEKDFILELYNMRVKFEVIARDTGRCIGSIKRKIRELEGKRVPLGRFRLSIVFPQALADRVLQEAREEGLTYSEMVRRIVGDRYEVMDREAKASNANGCVLGKKEN